MGGGMPVSVIFVVHVHWRAISMGLSESTPTLGLFGRQEGRSRAVRATVSRAGRLDLLSISGAELTHETVHEEPMGMGRLALAQGSGTIVNVASRAGLAGEAEAGPYSAAKSAAIRMTEAIATFRQEQGTLQTQGAMTPEVVAPAFVFFACSDSDYITGQVLAFNRK